MPAYNIKLHNIESLNEISKELGRIKTQLDVLIAILIEDGMTQLEIRNNTVLERGLLGFGKFLDAVREAHTNARIGRNKYSAETKVRAHGGKGRGR